MKIADEREMQKTTTKIKTKEQGGTESIVKGWEFNDFAVHLN